MARRSSQTPLQQIISFFLTAPLAEIRQGIEVGQEIVNHRLAGGAVATVPRRQPVPVPAAATVGASAGEQTAQVVPGAPRTRRKRSDAGVSRRRTTAAPVPAQPVGVASQPMPDTAANGPGPRRRRPAVTMAAAPVPAPVAVPDLPDQAVDPAGDVE